MADQLPPLPPLVVEEFSWQNSQLDAPIRQRRANGFEAIVGHKESNAAGANDLYLISSVRFADPALTLSQLQTKAERALVNLRYEHPEIAQTAVWEEGQSIPWIRYQSPKSNEEALAYAHQVIRVRAGTETALDIRTDIEAKRHREEGGSKPAEAVAIDIVAPVTGLDVALGSTDVEFLFHTNHLYFDGISKRIFASDFFRHLADEASPAATGELPDYKWGDELQNLAPPVLTLLKEGVKITGPEFDEFLKTFTVNSMKAMDNYGLKPKEGYGLPRTIFHTFTEEESSAIYKAVKSKVGPSASPAHLGQAAVFLALLKANPPTADTKETQAYVSASAVNGRRFLQSPESHKRLYPGAQSSCPCFYENIKQWKVVDASKEKVDEYLLEATKIAKTRFENILSEPTNLPATIALHNLVGQWIASGNLPTGATSAPIFASDGINETYIDREVTDKAGNTAFSVNTVRFFLNQYMPFMFVRLDSWRGRSELSLSYNDGPYTDQEASNFLKDVAALMLQFTQ